MFAAKPWTPNWVQISVSNLGPHGGLKMRSRSVRRGPILKSIMRPRFGVRFSFSLSVAPKWGPKSDPHYGSIFLAGWWVLVSWKRAPRLATASTKNGPKNGDQTETVCYISVLACSRFKNDPEFGAREADRNATQVVIFRSQATQHVESTFQWGPPLFHRGLGKGGCAR